jgi:hypothetical protein
MNIGKRRLVLVRSLVQLIDPSAAVLAPASVQQSATA